MSTREVEPSDWEGEAADQDRRIVTLGARVIAGAAIFFYGGFFFAFVFLRLQNVNGHWNHIDAKPSAVLGAVVVGATVLAAAVLLGIRSRLRRNEVRAWRGGALIALLLIVVAIVARIVQLWTLGLDPDAAGYVAVLIGWSVSLVVVELGALYWIESLVARAGRIARAEADPAAEAAAADVADADQRFLASASGFTLFWVVIAAVEVLAYILLDLVR